MVPRINVDFKELLAKPFESMGHKVFYQPCCQKDPYDASPGESESGWPLTLPDVDWGVYTLLILQCYDFLTVQDAGCLELKKIEKHYGTRSTQVVIVHWEMGLDNYYFGPLNLLYFPCHSFQLISDFKTNKDQWKPLLTSKKSIAWQCLNGRTTGHRYKIKELLLLLSNGIISYGNEIPLPQWPYNTYKGTDNYENWLRISNIYDQCAVNIVTETIYQNPLGIITEKTLLAFLSMQIPIVIGYAGIVRHCEQLGFDMFTDIVDITYDSSINSKRCTHAIEENIDLLQHGIDIEKIKSRLVYNQEWLLNLYPKKLLKDLEINALAIHTSLTNVLNPHTILP